MDDTQKYLPKPSGVAGVVIFFILLFVFAKWGPPINFSTVTQNVDQPMVVTGEGKATAVPDIAKISAGIRDSGTNLAQVQNSVNKKSQTLVAAFKKLGVEDKDIRTTSYNIYPHQDYQANPPTITGYEVSINYLITIRNLDKVNEALTAVPAAGANLVSGVSFDLSDAAEAKALDSARQDATAQAKAKAQSLAKAAGITLGKIINISEGQNAGSRLYSLPVSGGASLDKTVAEPNVQPGTTEINLTVSLSYEIR